MLHQALARARWFSFSRSLVVGQGSGRPVRLGAYRRRIAGGKGFRDRLVDQFFNMAPLACRRRRRSRRASRIHGHGLRTLLAVSGGCGAVLRRYGPDGTRTSRARRHARAAGPRRLDAAPNAGKTRTSRSSCLRGLHTEPLPLRPGRLVRFRLCRRSPPAYRDEVADQLAGRWLRCRRPADRR